MTGVWPLHEIDHKNGIKTDNRWSNLRAATVSENQQNSFACRKNNPTGFRGVSLCKSGRYDASIRINGKTLYLGRFDTAEEAGFAYMEAKKKLHPFANFPPPSTGKEPL